MLYPTLLTAGISVSLETWYIPKYSAPRQHNYMFGYRVLIRNHNTFRVRLLQRCWHQWDSPDRRTVVEGEGVIGICPVIEAGEAYHYVSGRNQQSDMGTIWGHYLFADGRLPIAQQQDAAFKVRIPLVQLIAPFKNN